MSPRRRQRSKPPGCRSRRGRPTPSTGCARSRSSIPTDTVSASVRNSARGRAMPVIYRIDPKQEVIRTKCVGNVTFSEVADHFRALQRDPECPPRLDVLLDLRETTSLPTDLQLKAVSEEISK